MPFSSESALGEIKASLFFSEHAAIGRLLFFGCPLVLFVFQKSSSGIRNLLLHFTLNPNVSADLLMLMLLLLNDKQFSLC